MAGKSFGGSVKLTGESEYRKALSEISQGLKVVSAEMKATASAFDADNMSKKELPNYSKGEERFNAITHIVGAGFGITVLVLGIIYLIKKLITNK